MMFDPFKKSVFGLFIGGVLCLTPTDLKALTPSFSAEFFRPAVDDSDYFGLYSSHTPKRRHYNVGFVLSDAQRPYEVGDLAFNRKEGIINNLLTGNVFGSFTPVAGFTVGARLPIYFLGTIRSPLLARPDENNTDLGDLELNTKIRLIDRAKHPVGLSVLPFITLPTATHAAANFTGNGQVTGGLKVIVDAKPHKRVSLALNAGYEIRPEYIDVGGNVINDHVTLGAGVDVDLIPRKLKMIAETEIHTVASDFFNRRTSPAEARFGFRYMFANRLDVNVGGGVGYLNGISSPQFRVFAGVSYLKRSIEDADITRPVGDVGLNRRIGDVGLDREIGDVELPGRKIGDVELGEELTLSDKIFFELDRDVIREISKPPLDKLAKFIKAHKEIGKLRVEGHTCDLGSDGHNLHLSRARAQAVVDYLVDQGVDRALLESVGFGKTKPQVSNTDEPHREQNRRVQIFVAEKKQK